VVITGIIVTILGCALAFSNMSHARAILSGFGIAFGGATIALLAKFYLPYKRGARVSGDDPVPSARHAIRQFKQFMSSIREPHTVRAREYTIPYNCRHSVD
jgi:hypothetical protein